MMSRRTSLMKCKITWIKERKWKKEWNMKLEHSFGVPYMEGRIMRHTVPHYSTTNKNTTQTTKTPINIYLGSSSNLGSAFTTVELCCLNVKKYKQKHSKTAQTAQKPDIVLDMGSGDTSCCDVWSRKPCRKCTMIIGARDCAGLVKNAFWLKIRPESGRLKI